jgi:hypothetical protein
VSPTGSGGLTRIFSKSPGDEHDLPPTAHFAPGTLHMGQPLDPVPEPKSVLRGTHLANRLCEKTFVNESIGCYDNNIKRFYST